MEIKLTVTEKDKILYNFLKQFKNEEYMMKGLNDAVETYGFCCGDDSEELGYTAPENLKERLWESMKKEDLLDLRNKYLEEVLVYAQDFHPDEIDCGIMRGPDTEYWFVDEDSRLGFITLYSNYIKMIDEVLNEKNN